jgi:hypothetical protein
MPRTGKDAAIEYVRAVVAAEETKELLADLARTQIGSVLNAEDTKQAARNFVEVNAGQFCLWHADETGGVAYTVAKSSANLPPHI